MKERPILFSSDMVKAVLDGRKTQTRRIIKPQPVGYRTCWSDDLEAGDTYIEIDGSVWKATESRGRNKRASGELTPVEIECPYGTIGDRLYVREIFRYAIFMLGCGGSASGVEYKGGAIRFDKRAHNYAKQHTNKDKKRQHAKWRSPTFMPKWAARIWLEKTSNRAPEFVQDISVSDCLAEGAKEPSGDFKGQARERFIRGYYQGTWDILNAKPKRTKHNPYTWAREDCYVGYPWEAAREEKTLQSGLKEYIVGNPWVWPLDFKRIKL